MSDLIHALSYRGFSIVQSINEVNALRESFIEAAGLDGDFAFFGVGQGGDAIYLATAIQKTRHFHFFDTFDGCFPKEAISPHIRIETQETLTFPCDLAALVAYIRRLGHIPHCHVGPFDQSLCGFNRPLVFAHVDADLYLSTITAIDALETHMVSGGIACFHDYSSWEGPTKAVDERLTEPQWKILRRIDCHLSAQKL